MADHRYDYIETGSLVSINRNVRDILIPSEERRIAMHPMDFEEFLWAMGDEMTMPFIRECFRKGVPMGPMHRKTMTLFRQYMLVGGMPQAVQKYVDTRSFAAADTVKRDILNLYRSDIHKYAIGYESKVLKIFDELPGQLQKHEKKFRLSALGAGARFRSYESSFVWLDESRVVNICHRATEPTVGLRMRQDDATMKLYMADTGLLVTAAFAVGKHTHEELYAKILLGKLEINEGMFVENIVAQMLRSSGNELFFFSSYSKTDASETMEVDFLMAKPEITSRHNVRPIEVKSSTRYTIGSLNKFIAKYGQQVDTAYVVHGNDYEKRDGIIYLPLYMTGCL